VAPRLALTVLRRRRAVVAAAAALVAVPAVGVAMVAVALGAGVPPSGAGDTSGVPPVALDAYRRAAGTEAARRCGLRWSVVAAVAKVESNHAGGRVVGPDGSVAPPVVGRPLDGGAGVARIPDTDGGRLDGDVTWDRAVGPLQFLPATWAASGADGSGDGVADPHNLYDAAAGAAAHLCAGGRRLDDDAVLRAALLAYNRSASYVEAVMRWVGAYDAAGGQPVSTQSSGRLVAVRGIVVDAALAPRLEALLAAAATDGVVLGGGGYRSSQAQIGLRRAHCGASDWAVHHMPASACSPPTARPGESLHEVGLAVDFTCAGMLVSRADACFAWLSTHAGAYGLANLPSEPWHWSVGGR
jgi:hypothetical protein